MIFFGDVYAISMGCLGVFYVFSIIFLRDVYAISSFFHVISIARDFYAISLAAV